MTTHPESKKNGRPTWQWLAVTVITLLSLVVGGWVGRVETQLERNQNKGMLLESRLSGVESTLIAIQTQLNNIHLDLRRALTYDEGTARKRAGR